MYYTELCVLDCLRVLKPRSEFVNEILPLKISRQEKTSGTSPGRCCKCHLHSAEQTGSLRLHWGSQTVGSRRGFERVREDGKEDREYEKERENKFQTTTFV